MTIHERLFRLLIPATKFRKASTRVNAGVQLVELVVLNLLSPVLFLPFALFREIATYYPVISITAYGLACLGIMLWTRQSLRKRQSALEVVASDYFASPNGLRLISAFGYITLSIVLMLAAFIQILRYYFSS